MGRRTGSRRTCAMQLGTRASMRVRAWCAAVGFMSSPTGCKTFTDKLAPIPGSGNALSNTSSYAQVLNAVLIFSTIHAQDFRDVDGDSASGRRTLATDFPLASRLSMMILLPGWSLFLACFWAVNVMVAVPFILLGSYVGAQFFLNRNEPSQDHTAYRNYNVRVQLSRSLR